MTTTRAKQPDAKTAATSTSTSTSATAKAAAAAITTDDQEQDQLSDDAMDVDVDDDGHHQQQEHEEEEEETATSSRRSSTRLRTRTANPPAAAAAASASVTPKPKSTPKTKPKATKAKASKATSAKARSKSAAAADSDQDENAATDDLSDEDEDEDAAHDHPSDDEQDDDFDTQPKKRTSRRSTATPKKAAPAATAATFKKPSLPASRNKKATTTLGGRKRGTVVRLNLDTTGLWDAVTTPNVAMSGIVKQWLTEYHVRPSDALLAVVNMILAATGCTESITPSRFEDQDAVPDYVEELQSHMTTGSTSTSTTGYPLISRTKTHKAHMSAFLSFFTHLISSDNDALWDDVLLQVIQQWVAALVSSPLRAFRHTATALGLHLATTLCTPLANEKHVYHDQVVDTHTALYDTIFVHRYRDVDAAIRKECMRALAAWVERVPDRFLDPTYLRYFGWLLNDQDAGVRAAVLECLAHLYSTPALVSGLRLFTERFKARMIQIAQADVDAGVQRAGVELVCLVYQMGVLGVAEVDHVCALVFSKHVQAGTGGVPEALVGVWKEETESMDWPRLVEWVARLIGGVYPEAKVDVAVDTRDGASSGSDTDDGDDDMGMPITTQAGRKSGARTTVTTVDPLKCDHALTLLATSLPTLPLFTSPDAALAHLRRTDTSLPHEHLLLALVCALASAARDATGRALAPHLPALLAKFKADDVALVYLYRAARTGVPVDAWTAAAGTAALDAVLAAGVAAMKRDAAPVVLDEVARLVGVLARRQETGVQVAPVVRRLVSDGCASERPATVVAVVKAVKVPEDVLGAEVRELVEGIEVGSVERVVARLMWLVQMAGVESKVGEDSEVDDEEEESKEGEIEDEDEERKKKKKNKEPKAVELSADLRESIHDLITECVDLLADPESYPARTRVAAANVLMESASIFSGVDLDDRALALLEQLIASRVKSLLMSDGQQDVSPQIDAHLNPTLAYLESDHALVRMFSKLVGVGAVDAAYAPTVLQFYRRPPVPAGEPADDTAAAADQPWSVDELARQLTYQADAVVMGEVLEKVPEATLVQVCLSAVQRAFRLSEADKDIVDKGDAKEADSKIAVEKGGGEPDRPGAVPRLAKALAEVFKRRKTANVKPVIAYGAQWVVEQFEPVEVPERPAPKPKAKKTKGKKKAEKPEGDEQDEDAMDVDKPAAADDDVFAKSDAEASGSDADDVDELQQEDDDADMQQYLADLADFHVRLNAALRNSAPIVKALKEFVPVLSISDARALYRQFRGSMVLEPLLPALAKKANVKHEPVVVHGHGHGAGMVLAATVAAAGAAAPKKRAAAAARTPKTKRAPAAGKKTAAAKVARPKKPQPKKRKAAWEAVVPGMSSDEEQDDDEDRIEDSDQEAPAAPTPARGRKRAKPDSDSDEEEDAPAKKTAPVKGTRTSTRRKAPVAEVVTPASSGGSDEEQQDGEEEHDAVDEDEDDEPDPPIKRRKFM